PTVVGRNQQDHLSYDLPELSKTPIAIKLMYELVGDQLVLVWNMTIDMQSNADYWDYNIDAMSGAFVSKSNFTTFCQHHPGAYAHHDLCAPASFMPNRVHQTDSNNHLNSSFAAASYNVFALPTESPIHGSRTMVTDDVYPQSSPNGWHDTNGIAGPEFTTTRGNNVYAYQDKDDNNLPDGPDTDGGSALNFNFPLDLSKDPRENANAAVTNLFYMSNMMHDVTNLLGFTEAFGNFQQKNYSGVALDGEGDQVHAQAFDGITTHEAGNDIVDGNPTKINNANFSTPNDGSTGRMQMFLWDNDGGSISIDEPETIKGFIAEYGTATFGKVIPNETEPAISGRVALLRDDSSNPTAGCGNVKNGTELVGRIALIDRGLCDFSKKVFSAQQAGAIAAIICNIAGVNGGNGEELIGMGGGLNAGSVTIPSVFLKKSDCDKIRLVLSNGGNVSMTFKTRERQGAKYLDGSLDNGIIAHEYGHGISNRLTGGRLASSCLTNDEQMGEGWSDFFGLVMTQKPSDKGSDQRGIGTFASAQLPTGGGIRRFAYSTDMSKNPQTLRDIKGTTGPHALGEVWADVLWDMYWAFIDQYGYNPDWTNKNSGNYKAVFLVMEGMKLQPCNPGFIQGRDAILKADEIQNNYAHKCLIWNVFARRGMGYYANGGDKNNRNDGTEDYEPLPTCIEKLKISKSATTTINPGDEVTVTLKAINHIPGKQSDVIITDELPSGMSYVNGSSTVVPSMTGNMLMFSIGELDYDKERVITYKTKSSIINKSFRLEYENFDGNFNWDIEKTKGNEDFLPTSDMSRSPDISFNILNVVAEVDAALRSIPYTVTGNNPVMRFWHRYNTQPGDDGGFVEISVNNSSFTPIKSNQFIRNSYNGPMTYSTLAIPDLDAFSGNSGGTWVSADGGPWIDSYIDLSEYKGKTVVFKFRFGSNATVAATGSFNGWFIDDFEILDIYKYTSQACIGSNGGNDQKACTKAIETLVNSGSITSNTKDENLNDFDVDIYPNPAKEYVVVSMKSKVNSVAKIELFTTRGDILTSKNMQVSDVINSVSLYTDELSSGIYIVKITHGNQSLVRKLVIQK
ncbi:MAG: M36 family metallopeptidase, partial [Saprospiraceae bacterium]